MISVCLATYNGARYIREQIESILPQLSVGDEIVISDDSSTDNTLEIVASFRDSRIKIFPNNNFHSPIFNFENALKKANGDFIFLSDQDDIWLANKVSKMLKELESCSLVISDCLVVDKNCRVMRESFFRKIPSSGILDNIVRNNFLGCCMAFRKEVLEKALPFPRYIAMHDIWLGLCASLFYKVHFISAKLILYRRHESNASPTGERSQYSIAYRILYRLYIIYSLIKVYILKR